MTPDEKHARFAAAWSPARGADEFDPDDDAGGTGVPSDVVGGAVEREQESTMDARGARGW